MAIPIGVLAAGIIPAAISAAGAAADVSFELRIRELEERLATANKANRALKNNKNGRLAKASRKARRRK